jgi:hypothetical protein
MPEDDPVPREKGNAAKANPIAKGTQALLLRSTHQKEARATRRTKSNVVLTQQNPKTRNQASQTQKWKANDPVVLCSDPGGFCSIPPCTKALRRYHNELAIGARRLQA